MRIEVIDEKGKLLYRALNSSILLFTLIWTMIFIGYFVTGITESPFIDNMTGYLIQISLLPFLFGIISTIAFTFSKEKFIELNEKERIRLILNLNEFDYKADQLRLLAFSGNFLEISHSLQKFEISAQQVKEIISVF